MARAMLLCLLALFSACASSFEMHDIADLRLDIDRCSVHDEPLIEDINTVLDFNGTDYNRVSYSFSHNEIRAALFPYAFDDPYKDGESGLAMVTYCPKCRIAQKKYVNDMKNWDPEEPIYQLDAKEYIKQNQSVEKDAEE